VIARVATGQSATPRSSRPGPAAGELTTREQVAALKSDAAFVRESRTLGATGPPLRWRDTRDDLVRRAAIWREALEASGVVRGDRVALRLPTFWAIGGDCWLALLDMDVLAMAVEHQREMAEFAPSVLIATPTDALRLATGSADVRCVVVTGEPGGSLPSTRRAIEDRLGARCVDAYALTELGVVGWTCAAATGGVHLDEDAFDVEALADGELVLSTRAPRDVMLRRYATGDLARLSRGRCACGSRWVRAEGGILGRTAERLVVRGVELLPSTIEDVVRRHPAVADFGLRVYQRGAECTVAVRIEPAAAIASEGDRARVAAEVSEDLKRSLGLRLQCDVVPPGSDGLGEQDAGRRARRLRRQSAAA
jgi:phenylacetate-CoA ligase